MVLAISEHGSTVNNTSVNINFNDFLKKNILHSMKNLQEYECSCRSEFGSVLFCRNDLEFLQVVVFCPQQCTCEN